MPRKILSHAVDRAISQNSEIMPHINGHVSVHAVNVAEQAKKNISPKGFATPAIMRDLVKERDLLAQVIQVAAIYGWRSAHFRPARTKKGRWITAVQGDGKGWPDLVLCHQKKGRLMFIELKTATGKVSPEQHAWFDALREVTFRCSPVVRMYLIRPADFDFLVEELKLE